MVTNRENIAVQRLVLSTFLVLSRLFRDFGSSGIGAKYDERKLNQEEVFGLFAFSRVQSVIAKEVLSFVTKLMQL